MGRDRIHGRVPADQYPNTDKKFSTIPGFSMIHLPPSTMAGGHWVQWGKVRITESSAEARDQFKQ